MTNFDLVAFVPLGCLVPTASFYDRLVFQTLTPLIIVALLWTPAAIAYVTGKPSMTSATRIAARFSLFLVELLVSGVSTTIVRTFSCDKFDDGWFLSAQLSIACDDSNVRRFYLTYAVFMLLAFPVGEPRPVLYRRLWKMPKKSSQLKRPSLTRIQAFHSFFLW